MSVITKISFSRSAVSSILHEVNSKFPNETGGVLVGRIQGNTIIIDTASGPGPKAIHSPVYFRADSNYIDMFVEMEIANSIATTQYIGEWHSHPQITPEPSTLDLNSLIEIAESAASFALVSIVGAIHLSEESFLDQIISIAAYRNSEDLFSLECSKFE